VRQLAESGFKYLELSGGTKYYDNYLNDLSNLKAVYNLKYLIHNYFPPQREDFVLNLISSDDSIYQRSLQLIRDAIALSKKFEAILYSFHPGYIIELKPNKDQAYFGYTGVGAQNKREKEELFYHRFSRLLDSLSADCQIAVENLFPFSKEEDYSLFSQPQEIINFLKKYYDHLNVGILIDLGHLNMASHYLGFDKFRFLEELFSDFSSKVVEIHLSDNDGSYDHHKITSLTSWQISWLTKNRALMGNIPLTLEWRNDTPNKAIYEHYCKIVDILDVSEK
jgi:sugar phosphate isomerase/epimerase